ncbi:MAG TPA: Ig domain-containing protein [Myxococcota bacterium]|nr:Ig domain-containing protein [Myxococcota bacterium]HOH77343.1 Ig domain-containing protein [Myxococcota bacterium]HPV04073.1 Ig domain-containing protein [Myxococcota bacterium]
MFRFGPSVAAIVATLVLGCSGGPGNPDAVEPDDVPGDISGDDVPSVPDTGNPADAFDAGSDSEPGDLPRNDGQEVAIPDDGSSEDVPVLPELVLTRTVVPVVDAGLSLNHALEATGGQPPYSDWTIVKGSLPAGVELDAETGIISGVPSERGFSWFVVEVGDSAGNRASELFGIRVGDPVSTGPLRERADAYQAVYEARHDWGGFSYNCNTPDDPDGNLRLTTLGDATFQSGQCTMAMAYRDAVERTQQTSAYLKKQVDGWRFFQNLTGVPGLIGRSWGKVDYPWEDNHHRDGFWPDNPDSHSYRAEGDYEGYIWVGDVSRDQASGAVLGVAAAYDLADDPETKATAAAFLTDLVDHVWENNLDFKDRNDKPPRYGNIDGDNFEGWPYPNGLNAACSLAWFRIAAHVAEAEGLDDAGRFRERYQELVSRGYIGYMRDYMWVYDGYNTKHYNTYMAYENLFHLARLEDDPVLGPQIDDIFRDTLWLNLDDNTPNRKGVKEGNPVKTTWYLYSTGDRDPVALWDALWQVVVFPDAPLRDRYVKNSDDPEIVVNPDEPTESLYPLPSNRLQPDMVIWHRSTFLLDGGVDSGEERTGCDYLLPYWMGRYYGWIDAAW